jgi:hypothetical protein
MVAADSYLWWKGSVSTSSNAWDFGCAVTLQVVPHLTVTLQAYSRELTVKRYRAGSRELSNTFKGHSASDVIARIAWHRSSFKQVCFQSREEMDAEKLINLVFGEKALWDQKMKTYHNREVSRKLWQKISKDMNITSKYCNFCLL